MSKEVLSPRMQHESLHILEEARALSLFILDNAGETDQEENPHIKYFIPQRRQISKYDVHLNDAVETAQEGNLYFPGSRFEGLPRLKVEGEVNKQKDIDRLRITLFVKDGESSKPVVSLLLASYGEIELNSICLLFWKEKNMIHRLFDRHPHDTVILKDYILAVGEDCNLVRQVMLPCLGETAKIITSYSKIDKNPYFQYTNIVCGNEGSGVLEPLKN